MLAWLVTLFVFGMVALIIMAACLLPVLIGWLRHVADLGSLAVINIALGWTLVGWVIALAMALRTHAQSRHRQFRSFRAFCRRATDRRLHIPRPMTVDRPAAPPPP